MAFYTFFSFVLLFLQNKKQASAIECHQTVQLTIQTWSVAAAVQLLLTIGASVARRAAAGVASSHGLHTGAAVEARTICTCHSNDLTVLSIKTLRARARVVILQVLLTIKETIINIRAGRCETLSNHCSAVHRKPKKPGACSHKQNITTKHK